MPHPLDLQNRLDEISALYEHEQDALNMVLAQKAADIIAPRVQGKRVLEMGCSMLAMTKTLAASSSCLDIVEGAINFVELARISFPGVTVYHSLFEAFEPERKYEAIVLANTLHHIHEPQQLLRQIRSWLVPGGSLHLTVPNMYSLHRRMGVKMGRLKDVFDTTDLNTLFEQPGRFTKERLVQILHECGFTVTEAFGFFLKPFSDAQMASLSLPDEAIDALFELGREFEELASKIYVEATVSQK